MYQELYNYSETFIRFVKGKCLILKGFENEKKKLISASILATYSSKDETELYYDATLVTLWRNIDVT
jgi:hypothetical protein